MLLDRHMKMKSKWLLLAAVMLVLALALAACGGDDSDNSGGSAQAPPAGPGNATDAMFVNSMIPHHEGAVEMAQIAQERAEHPEIKKLADEIITAQEREIGIMEPIRERLAKEHGSAQMEGDHGMAMSEEDLTKLRGADPFDREFIDMMIPHHEGAVTMAEEELDKGENTTLRKLAEDIISSQNREIEQMESWRKEWYGSTGNESGDDSEEHGGH
jgi:uncharacterized protein (DUF305 family)